MKGQAGLGTKEPKIWIFLLPATGTEVGRDDIDRGKVTLAQRGGEPWAGRIKAGQEGSAVVPGDSWQGLEVGRESPAGQGHGKRRGGPLCCTRWRENELFPSRRKGAGRQGPRPAGSTWVRRKDAASPLSSLCTCCSSEKLPWLPLPARSSWFKPSTRTLDLSVVRSRPGLRLPWAPRHFPALGPHSCCPLCLHALPCLISVGHHPFQRSPLSKSTRFPQPSFLCICLMSP